MAAAAAAEEARRGREERRGANERFIVIKIMAAGRSENCVHIAFSKSFPEIVSILFCLGEFFFTLPSKKKIEENWIRYMILKRVIVKRVESSM